jgi:hypothetical protein
LLPLPLAGEGWGEGKRFGNLPDLFHDRIRFIQYFVIPESERLESFAAHRGFATRVVRSRFDVLPAIQFDHEPEFDACEIGDEIADGSLAPKFQPG